VHVEARGAAIDLRDTGAYDLDKHMVNSRGAYIFVDFEKSTVGGWIYVPDIDSLSHVELFLFRSRGDRDHVMTSPIADSIDVYPQDRTDGRNVTVSGISAVQWANRETDVL
jgi:hypothetical protein